MYFVRDDNPRPDWHCCWYDGFDQVVAPCAASSRSRVIEADDGFGADPEFVGQIGLGQATTAVA